MKRRAGVVLNTRPRDQAAELSRLLANAGFEVVEAPAIETIAAWDPAELEAVRANLADGAYEWIVLPSQNSGRLLLPDLARVRLLCGSATAQALGLTPAVKLERFSASAALDALGPLVRPGQRILIPRANESRDELAEGLLALGAEIHAPVAYRTVTVEPSLLADAAQRLCQGTVHAVTVCSPSAVQSLLGAVGRETLLTSALICLGETTAETAHEAGLRVDGIAEMTTMASLVDAVIAAMNRPRARTEAPPEAREVPV